MINPIVYRLKLYVYYKFQVNWYSTTVFIAFQKEGILSKKNYAYAHIIDLLMSK